MIEGVVIKPLNQFDDERGKVMHMLRSDSELFERFGEVYFSYVNPGKIKAWKRHQLMTQLLTVPYGEIEFVLFDDRIGSATCGQVQTVLVGEDEHRLLKIPPLIWYGFKGMAQHRSLIVNCADLPHDTNETERLHIDNGHIPYSW